MGTTSEQNLSVKIKMIPEKMARDAYFYAVEAAYLEHDFGCIPNAYEPYAYMIFYVKKGAGMLSHKNKEHLLVEGSLVYLSCKDDFSLSASKDCGWNALYLCFGGKQAKGNYRIISRNLTSPILYIENDSMIHGLIWQIISLHEEKKRNAEALTSLNITKLLTEINIMSDAERKPNAAFSECVHYVFHHVARHYAEKITLDIIASKYHVSKFHMSREFKRYTGITVNNYIINTRMHNAKTLLRDSDKNLSKSL